MGRGEGARHQGLDPTPGGLPDNRSAPHLRAAVLPPWGRSAISGRLRQAVASARRCGGSGMSAPPSGQGLPITDRRELVAYLEQGCKPRAAWRIGTEHEKFGFTQEDLRRLPYEGP